MFGGKMINRCISKCS